MLCYDSFIHYDYKKLDDIQVQEIPMKSFVYSHGRYKLVSWFSQQQQRRQRRSSILINSPTAIPSSAIDSDNINDNESSILTQDELAAVFCDDPHDGQKRQAFLQLACYIDLDSQISVKFYFIISVFFSRLLILFY